MKSPQWVDNSRTQHPSLSPPPGGPSQSICQQHLSPEPQSPSPPASRYSSPLTVSTPAAGMQRPRFGRLSVSDQSPQHYPSSLPRRISSPPPNRVTPRRGTEDSWAWGQNLRTPQLSLEDREALRAERWQDDDEETVVQLDAPDSPHLTYQEPPPRPAEDTHVDETTNFETFIIITSPTGDNCVYGVSAEMAARIQRDLIFAKAKPISLDSPSVVSQKRKATLPHTEQPPRKRATPPRHRFGNEHALPEGRATPMVGVSRLRKRQAEDDLHTQEISSSQSNTVFISPG